MQVNGKMRQKLPYFRLAHLGGMAFVVKEDEAFNPIYVSVFGFAAVVFYASDDPHLIK